MFHLKPHMQDWEFKVLHFLDAESRMDALLCIMAYAFIALCVVSFVYVVGGFVLMLLVTMFAS